MTARAGARWLLGAGALVVAAAAVVAVRWAAGTPGAPHRAPAAGSRPLLTAPFTVSPAGVATPVMVLPGRDPRHDVLLGWDGRIGATLTLAQPMAVIGQAPDGSRFVADIASNHGPVRWIVRMDRHVVATLDRGDQFLWGDDSRHVCLVHDPMPAGGSSAALEVVDPDGTTRRLASLGPGDGLGGVLYEVDGCSPGRDLAVVVVQRIVASAGLTLGEAQTVRGYAISSGRLVWQRTLSGARVHVIVSRSGAFLAEETLAAPFDNLIIRTRDWSTVGRIDDRIVLGFTSDDRDVVVGLQTSSPGGDTLELRGVSGSPLLASLSGHLTALLLRPESSDVFVALTTTTTPQPLQAERLVIIRGDGTVVPVAGLGA